MLECTRMTRETASDARLLLERFLSEDEYYLASSEAYGHGGSGALDQALALFVSKPELGFVWLAYESGIPVAVCIVCFAISTSTGTIVAKLDDVYVDQDKQGKGIGSLHLSRLKQELVRMGVKRIDTSVHHGNNGAERFYLNNGFRFLNEERLSCVLP